MYTSFIVIIYYYCSRHCSTDRDYMDDQTSRREMREKIFLDTTTSCNSAIARMITYNASSWFLSFSLSPNSSPPSLAPPPPAYVSFLFSLIPIVNTFRYDFSVILLLLLLRFFLYISTTDSLACGATQNISHRRYMYDIVIEKHEHIDMHTHAHTYKSKNDKHKSH